MERFSKRKSFKSILIFNKMKKLLIFDFDGVLEDTFDWNFNVAKERYKKIDKEDYRSWFNGNIYEHPTVLEAGPMNVTEYFDIYRKGFVDKKLKDKFKKLIEDLFKKYTLVIISSICEDIINPYLKRNQVSHFFKDVWGYQTETSKIKKFKKFLEKYNVSKEECLFITDTLGDIKEADKVGIDSIGVSWGYHSEETLLKGNPVFVANNVKELGDFLFNKVNEK